MLLIHIKSHMYFHACLRIYGYSQCVVLIANTQHNPPCICVHACVFLCTCNVFFVLILLIHSTSPTSTESHLNARHRRGASMDSTQAPPQQPISQLSGIFMKTSYHLPYAHVIIHAHTQLILYGLANMKNFLRTLLIIHIYA